MFFLDFFGRSGSWWDGEREDFWGGSRERGGGDVPGGHAVEDDEGVVVDGFVEGVFAGGWDVVLVFFDCFEDRGGRCGL